MTRKRIRHARIPNESKRNATFGRRTNGFLKKANEYSTLCGVDVGIIVHKQGENNTGENNTLMWPSPEIFRERLQKFMDFPNTERTRKMVTHEKFLEQIIAAETDTLVKSKAKVQLKESEQLLNQLTQGKHVGGKCVDEFDLHQLKCLSSFIAQMLEKLDKREVELNNEQQQGQPPLPLSTSDSVDGARSIVLDNIIV
ncbi:mads-box transcription factor pheres 1 [Phtheirospermum japonicum]|uniref:Mads-box transcription factor pheres 1 n=1 Tax=Phtheirospermum japonicum TaxID=374723 RepID=A0A830CR79_9LAMI|nr:mads-box transcription factor pheres 1 [Phtheirospermum japonicum]